jgi:saccharopine dehydrogenase-like NADP-dependent oxidoreductase
MKKKILIFGGGQIGEEVARDLAWDYDVSIVDKKYRVTHIEKKIRYIAADYREADILAYDLIINCLPAAIGYEAASFAMRNRVDCVDVSFMKEDPFGLDGIAKWNNCILVPDAGLAPGLSNLFVGRQLGKYGKLRMADIFVGGISKSPFEPYGFKATWSVEDLMQEYIRPARYVSDHKIVTADPFKSVTCWRVNGVTLESFMADGLRTLLRKKDKIGSMFEQTLRWPGHMKAVKKLIDNGTFVKEIKEKCIFGEDTVVFQVRTQRTINDPFEWVTMIDQGTNWLSAMSQCTGYTTAVVARLVIEGVYNRSGVRPLEEIGKNPIAFQFILDNLAERGIIFDHETNS